MKRKSWKDEEIEKLKKLAGNGRPWASIKTEFHGRSIAALQRRWAKENGNGIYAKTADAQPPQPGRPFKTLTILEGNKLVEYREILA